MKIIHLTIGKANPERLNGVNKAVHYLATNMVKQEYDIEVWGLTQTPDAETPKRDYPLHLFDVSPKSFALNPLIAEAIDALPPSAILHFHGGFIPAFYRIAKYADKKKLAWVISPHGAYMPQSIKRNYIAKNIYLNMCEKYLLKNAKAVHALTDLESQAIETVYKNASIATVPNAHVEETLSAKKGFAEIYSHARPVFCYMGRLDKVHKGLDLLFEGFSHYIAAGGVGELWIVGEGPHQRYLEHYAMKRGLASHVRFWGARFGDERINILKNAQVFLHTSRWEGMPMALLEAAAQNLPLLISKGTGISAAVEKWKAGIVLEENTASEIAKAMLQCQQLHKINRLSVMGVQAAEMVKNDFNWQKVVQLMTDKIYKVA